MATVEIPEITCRRCGHAWIPRQADVRMCPHCKSVRFDQPPTPKKVVVK